MDNPLLNAGNAGEFHNKQMETYYQKLSDLVKRNGPDNVKPEETRELFVNLLYDVYGKDNSTIISAAVKGYDSAYGKKIEEIAEMSITDIRSIPYKNTDVKDYLIDVIKSTDALTFDDASQFFDNKLKEAESKFKDQDLEVVKSSLNTGKASYKYWGDNYSNWYDLFDQKQTTAARGRGGRRVGIADTACFVSGAIWGAIGGTATLPGVGTVTGALAVGTAYGLYGSIAAGVYNAVSLIFGD